MDRFDKFTDRARRALTDAQREAARFHQNYIGAEHLLLGLIGVEDGVAAKALVNLGVELSKVRTAVEFLIGSGDRPTAGEVGLTPAAKRVIELAIDEARSLGHRYIGTEHILLGLLREGENVGGAVLESLGVTLAVARREVVRLAPAGPSPDSEAQSDPRPTLGAWGDFLAIRWAPEGSEGIGELLATASAKGFAGRSSAYFSAAAVLSFAACLSEDPLAGDPLELRSGHASPVTDVVDEHVGIAVTAVGHLGQIGLSIHLAERWPARPERRSDVRLELLTTDERLRRFGAELGLVVRGQQVEARLDGEVLRGA
jgi:hypothetical protein